MTDNIVVPQSPSSPGVIVTDNDKGHYGHHRGGLEGKDASFIFASDSALSRQMLNTSVNENRFQMAVLAKDTTIELLKADSRRQDQIANMEARLTSNQKDIVARLDIMQANNNAAALQAAKDEVQLLKIKFGVVP